MSNLPHIYVDMDGVLCDFKTLGEKVLHMKMSDWTNEPGHKFKTDKEKWQPILDYPNFWQKLPMMPGAMQLWNFVKPYNPSILSAYVEHVYDPQCIPGKRAWIHNHLGLPDSRINLVMRKQKQNFAMYHGERAILIDDYIKNVSQFSAKGGIGILHTSAANTINQLKKLGFK
jgi:5'(3')-deoxyribonucleotidase